MEVKHNLHGQVKLKCNVPNLLAILKYCSKTNKSILPRLNISTPFILTAINTIL